MLVITRREGEAFQIGPEVWVKICRIKGNQARIAIDAPRDVKILRDDHEGYVQSPHIAAHKPEGRE